MTQLGIKVHGIEWNDKNYQNDWFEVDGYCIDDHIDINETILQQEKDCNQIENRNDLVITNYSYTIYTY